MELVHDLGFDEEHPWASVWPDEWAALPPSKAPLPKSMRPSLLKIRERQLMIELQMRELLRTLHAHNPP